MWEKTVGREGRRYLDPRQPRCPRSAYHAGFASRGALRKKISVFASRREGFRSRDFVYGQDADGQISLYLVRLGS